MQTVLHMYVTQLKKKSGQSTLFDQSCQLQTMLSGINLYIAFFVVVIIAKNNILVYSWLYSQFLVLIVIHVFCFSFPGEGLRRQASVSSLSTA